VKQGWQLHDEARLGPKNLEVFYSYICHGRFMEMKRFVIGESHGNPKVRG
jgi:hypothetical protein